MLKLIPLQQKPEETTFSQNLYEQSFPIEERRDFSKLIEIQKNNPLELNIIYNDTIPVGILHLWDFNDFIYIEHLAINPQYRNQKIATTLLTTLNKTDKPIILEVELPTDEMSTRRIAFYQRNGFSIQAYKYYQPPYRKGENSIEMHLMANTKQPLQEREYTKITNTIRKKVYEKFW